MASGPIHILLMMEAVIEQDLSSTWRRSMDGAPDAESLFISQFTCNDGNVTR